jgi:hypothetical protein
MAIYSLHHSAIGKSTQASRYTAGAHIEYITRARALTRVDGERLPTSTEECVGVLRAGEDKDRANARVIDKVMLALPKELTGEQRAALVRGFAEEVTEGRAGWLAAFHESGKDESNPHVHLVIRDRDAAGKRVAKLSEKGSTERLRALWEVHANRQLALASRPERINRRTLKAQGIDRTPTIHEGVRSRRLRRQGRRLESRARMVRNSALAKARHRRVDYASIDGGRSRGDYNLNIRPVAAGPEREYWEAIDSDTAFWEIEALRAIHRPDDGQGRLPDGWLGRRAVKRRRKPRI